VHIYLTEAAIQRSTERKQHRSTVRAASYLIAWFIVLHTMLSRSKPMQTKQETSSVLRQ
jgi:uncharacterized membrane protein YozB (DUF420 family)